MIGVAWGVLLKQHISTINQIDTLVLFFYTRVADLMTISVA